MGSNDVCCAFCAHILQHKYIFVITGDNFTLNFRSSHIVASLSCVCSRVSTTEGQNQSRFLVSFWPDRPTSHWQKWFQTPKPIVLWFLPAGHPPVLPGGHRALLPGLHPRRVRPQPQVLWRDSGTRRAVALLRWTVRARLSSDIKTDGGPMARCLIAGRHVLWNAPRLNLTWLMIPNVVSSLL